MGKAVQVSPGKAQFLRNNSIYDIMLRINTSANNIILWAQTLLENEARLD